MATIRYSRHICTLESLNSGHSYLRIFFYKVTIPIKALLWDTC